MGIMDGAANRLMSRLTAVGVPNQVAFILGQAAYVSPRKQLAIVPTSVVPKSELTWWVSEAVKDLRIVSSPAAHEFIVQGLCRRVFGTNADHVLSSVYGAMGRDAPIAGAQVPQDLRGERGLEDVLSPRFSDHREYALRGCRYFTTPFDANGRYEMAAPGEVSNLSLALPCYVAAERIEDYEQGVLVASDQHVGFFNQADLEVDDLNQGSPDLAVMSRIKSVLCRVPQHIYPSTEALPKLFVAPGDDNAIISIAIDDGAIWAYVVPADMFRGDSGEEQAAVLVSFMSFLALHI